MEPSPDSRQHAPDPQGFSLVEVLAAITIIGIIVFLAVPNIVQVKQDAEDNLARSRAQMLNMAQAAYIQAMGTNIAQSNWSAGDSNARYGYLRPYIAFSETNFSAFQPGGYAFFFPTNIPSKVTVSNTSKGTRIDY